jgi:hypothetical protein
LLLLSERNLNKVDRVEPTRLRPSNDFSEITVGSLEGQVVLVLTEDDELNDQEHSRGCYIPLNAETADLSRSGTLCASFAGPRLAGDAIAQLIVIPAKRP